MPKTIQYPKGSVIFFGGKKIDQIYILEKGSVVLTHTEPDTKQPVSIPISAGKFFGVKYTLIGAPNVNTATATSDCTVISLTTDEFEKLIIKDQDLMFKMLRAFSTQVTEFHKKLTNKFNIKQEKDFESGMFSVAESFLSTNEYQQCIDVCERFLELYKNSNRCDDVRKMIEKSREGIDIAEKKAAETNGTQPENVFEALPDAIPYLPESFKRFEKYFDANRVILSEFDIGDNFYLVQSGVVRLTKYLGGRNRNVALIKPGDFFGLHELLSEEVHSATCITASKVKVLEFTKENFEPVVTSIPQTGIMLLKLFARMVNDDMRMYRNLCIDNMQMRITDLFLMFDEMGMGERLNTRTVRFLMSVHDVAQWLALSDEETKSKLSQLESIGQIQIEEGLITVIDINDLRRVVETYVK